MKHAYLERTPDGLSWQHLLFRYRTSDDQKSLEIEFGEAKNLVPHKGNVKCYQSFVGVLLFLLSMLTIYNVKPCEKWNFLFTIWEFQASLFVLGDLTEGVTQLYCDYSFLSSPNVLWTAWKPTDVTRNCLMKNYRAFELKAQNRASSISSSPSKRLWIVIFKQLEKHHPKSSRIDIIYWVSDRLIYLMNDKRLQIIASSIYYTDFTRESCLSQGTHRVERTTSNYTVLVRKNI